MNEKSCPLCHTSIPEHAPGGLCPACVLRGADETPEPANGPTVEEVAASFPKLEILRLIGHGGMGYVYQARQPELDRMVALKILSPALRQDPAFEERFAREARVLGKLKHPNIVTLYEHGESGGYFYLMMEFVDGVNLRQAMSAGRFSPEQALAIVPSICDALQSAHAQGVWHRDIKPENILLDKDGRVKIADFGIARIIGDPERNFTLTRTGGQLGSVAYMAPEQHEKPHSVDHRADIYSLGVVIYEMLTGELPLGRFPLPSQRAEVGKRIDEIVLRTLEKERELRQQSAAEVKTEVETIASSPRSNRREKSPAKKDELGIHRDDQQFILKGALVGGCAGGAIGLVLMLLNKAGVPMSQKFLQAVVPVIFLLAFGVGIVVMRKGRLKAETEAKSQVGNVASDFNRSLATDQNGLKSGASLQTPRFSRTAIVGLICLLLSLISLLYVASLWPEFPGDLSRLDHDFVTSRWLHAAVLGLFLELACTSLGWTAVVQIRRSEGKLHGMWLAVFDGLFFPLLALDVGILAAHLYFNSYPNPDGTRAHVFAATPLELIGFVGVLVFDWLIIRSVWRAVNRADEKQPRPAPAHSPSPERLEAHGWISAILFLASFSGAVLLFFNAHTIWKNHMARQWPVTEGRIISSRTYLQDAGGSKGNAKVARADVRYSYSVNGRNYESANVSFAGNIGGRITPAAVDNAVRYPEGTKVRVAYNPGNPAEAVLDISSDPYGWLALGLLLFASFPVWRMANRPLSGNTPEVAPRPLNRVAIAVALLAMMAGIFGVMVWVASPTGPGGIAAEFTSPVTVHCRVFEAQSARVDKLVPPDTRVRGDEREKQPGEVRSGTPPNAVAQMAEIKTSAVDSLLAGVSTDLPLLLDQRQKVLTWPRMANGGNWLSGNRIGSVGGFVGVRRVNGNLELRVDCKVSHSTLGDAPFIDAEIFYKGDAPETNNARAFFIPFAEKGVEKYLVVTFELEAEAKADAQNLSFGPVVERMLPLEPNGSAYIDFQTGNILNKQWKLEDAIQDEKVIAWMKSTGADANAYLLTEADAPVVEPRDPNDLWPRLIGTHGGCTFVLARNETFESARAEDADSRLKEIPGRNIVQEYAIGPQPYWFKTGDGAKGIVQIHSLTSNPRAAQIRYKLVQNATSLTTSGQSAAIAEELSGKISDWLNERGVTMDGLRFERAPGSDSRVFASYTGRKFTGEIGDTQGQVLLNFTAPNQWTLYGMGEFGGKNAEWHLENSGWPDQWPGLSFDEFRRMVETSAEAAKTPARPAGPNVIEAAAANPKITWANGLSFEVIGVLRNPRDSKQWFHADGTTFEHAPAEVLNLSDVRGDDRSKPRAENEVLVFYRMSGPAVTHCGVDFEPKPVSLMSTGRLPAVSDLRTGKDDQSVCHFELSEAQSELDTLDLTVNLVAADAPWEAVASFDGKETKELIPGVKVVFSPLHDYDASTSAQQFEVLHDIPRDEFAFRLFAKLKTGERKQVERFYDGPLGGMPPKGVALISKNELDVRDVREFILERAPLLRGKISHVAMRQGVAITASPIPQKPISPEAVAAYRELREFQLSKQPREFMDPDVRKKWGGLGKRFMDSLRGTVAEPLWMKAERLMEDSQRASAKGNDAEEQRLRKEADQIEKEIQVMLEQAGAPKYPDENSAAGSKPPVSKAAVTPSEQSSSAPPGFGLQGTRTFSPEKANRDGVIGYRFSDNDEVAVPDTVTGHFRDASKAGFTPELKQWMRDNRVDLLLHLAEKTYDVLTLDMLDRFVGEPLTWGDATPAELEQALKRCGVSGGTPESGMTSGRGYTSGPTDVNLFRTRDGATGCYQISASSNVVGRRVVIQSKLIPPRKGMAAARLLPGSEFSRAVADPADYQSQCLVSLDTGTVSSLPEELKTKLDVQNPRETDQTFIAWMRERRADAVARFVVTDGKVEKFGLRTFGVIAIPLHEGTPEQITSEEAEKRLDKSLTEWGFIPEVNDLMTDPGKPVAFLVQSRSGQRGILRITGFEEHPRGVNIHFRLMRTGKEDHPAQTTAVESASQKPSFGPVMEREIWVGGIDGNGPTHWLNLDTGALFTKPEGWWIDHSQNEKERSTLPAIGFWGDEKKFCVTAMGMDRLDVVSFARWDSATADAIAQDVRRLGAKEPISANRMVLVTGDDRRLPKAYVFKAANGSGGIIQVSSLGSPNSVKVRYKLVQSGPPNPAIEPAPQKLSFGPVMERVIEPTNSDRRALNLAFGNFISPGPGRKLDFTQAGTNTLRAAGADLYAEEGSAPGVLMALDMRLCVDSSPAKREDFDNLTAEQLEQALAHMANWRENMEAAPIPGMNFRNATSHITKDGLYLFITRNDVKGVLQAFSDPHGVKIRFKLAHSEIEKLPLAVKFSLPKTDQSDAWELTIPFEFASINRWFPAEAKSIPNKDGKPLTLRVMVTESKEGLLNVCTEWLENGVKQASSPTALSDKFPATAFACGGSLYDVTVQLLRDGKPVASAPPALAVNAEITRTLNDPGVNLKDCAISFRTGGLISLPPEHKSSLVPENPRDTPRAFAGWMQDHGADAVARVIVEDGKVLKYGLRTFGPEIVPIDEAFAKRILAGLKNPGFDQAYGNVGFLDGPADDFLIEPGKTAFFAVQFSRLGRWPERGILCLAGLSENPRGVKIRYIPVQTTAAIPTIPADDDLQLAEQPPVVVETFPVSGTRDVAPGETEIRVRFSKPMSDAGWSWCAAWENSMPETIGQPHYEADGKTCVLKVKLEAGRTYAYWLNHAEARNFTSSAGQPAVPYLLIFQTRKP